MILKVRAIEKHTFRSVISPSFSLLHSLFSSLSTLFLSTPIDNRSDSFYVTWKKRYMYILFPFSSYVKNSIVIFLKNFTYLLGPGRSLLQHVGSSNFVAFGIQFPAAAAAAKSLQSCPTLCNPTDGSPPGSSVPGILQARTLEWVAISFSNA